MMSVLIGAVCDSKVPGQGDPMIICHCLPSLRSSIKSEKYVSRNIWWKLAYKKKIIKGKSCLDIEYIPNFQLILNGTLCTSVRPL